MKRDNLPWRAVQPATLYWNESGVPVSDTFDDVYYSQENGLEESRHVFLKGNDLPQRFVDTRCGHPVGVNPAELEIDPVCDDNPPERIRNRPHDAGIRRPIVCHAA